VKAPRRILLTLLLVSCLYWLGSPSWADLWDDPGFEDEPANTDPLSEADDRMREIKVETRRRAEVETWWGAVGAPPGDDDNGLNRLGSARVFFQDAEPTALDGGAGDYNSITDAEQAVTDLNDSASNSGGAIEDDVGHGRLWVDANSTPSDKLYVYRGVAGDDNGAWEAVSAVADPTTDAIIYDDEILAGNYNLVYNGSFEATDGTGSEASTTVPEGWTIPGTATIAYGTATDLNYGDGTEVEVTAVAATDGIEQALDNLPANAVFKVIARAKDDGTGTCTLDIQDETGAAFTPDTTATDDWETLTGTFGTGAGFEDVDLLLQTNGAGQACLWDNIVVYSIGDVATDRDEISQPGIQKMRATYTGGALNCGSTYADAGCLEAQTGLSVIVTPPGPGYIVQLNAMVDLSATGTGVTGICMARLYDATNATLLDEVVLRTDGNADITESSTSLHATAVNPTPGTSVTYQIDAYEANTDCKVGNAVDSWIEALLIPTR
jgi:hypothetical protein